MQTPTHGLQGQDAPNVLAPFGILTWSTAEMLVDKANRVDLFSLPAAIRSTILHLCLEPSQIPALRERYVHDWFRRFSALLRTCHQLRCEAGDIFFDTNTFHFETFMSAVCGRLECTPFFWLIDHRDNKHAIPSSVLSLFPVSKPMRHYIKHMQLRVDCSAFSLGVGIHDPQAVPPGVDFLQPLSQLDALGFTGLKTLRLLVCDPRYFEGTAKRYRIHTRTYRERHELPKGVFKIEFISATPWSLEGPVRFKTR